MKRNYTDLLLTFSILTTLWLPGSLLDSKQYSTKERSSSFVTSSTLGATFSPGIKLSSKLNLRVFLVTFYRVISIETKASGLSVITR